MRVLGEIHSISSPAISADGRYLACLRDSQVEIWCMSTLSLIREIPATISKGVIRWSSSRTGKLLLHDGQELSIWDVEDEEIWLHVSFSCDAAGRLMAAAFGPDDRSVVLSFEFPTKCLILDTKPGRMFEFHHPKAVPQFYGFRAGSGNLALLCRPTVQDIVTIHKPQSHEAVTTRHLSTIDAQGISWSPDGNYLAVWDSPTYGASVQLFNADGNHFGTISMPSRVEHKRSFQDGVKSLVWSPTSGSLALATVQDEVQIFTSHTFSRSMTFTHVGKIDEDVPCEHIWQETFDSNLQCVTYKSATRPIVLPTPDDRRTVASPVVGISILSYNVTGSRIATKSEATPSTIWIWNVVDRRLETVVVQLSPVRQLEWHPTNDALLLITLDSESISLIRILDLRSERLLVFDPGFPPGVMRGKLELQWVEAETRNLCVAYNETTLIVTELTDPSDADKNTSTLDDSLDSVYEALVGSGIDQ